MIARLLFAWTLFLSASPALAAFDSASLPTSGPLSIVRVTPDGNDVPNGQQIAIEFNRAVVPLGKMDRRADELPITITPALNCHWRWINTRTLACDLDDNQKLQAATQYNLEVRPGIQTEDGTTLSETYQQSFITRRPSVVTVDFRYWKSPGIPVLRVVWDQPVTKTSVLAHLYMSDTGSNRIPMAVSADQEKRILPSWLHLPGEKKLVHLPEDEQASDTQLTNVNGVEARRIWIVEPLRDLPADTDLSLHVEPGLVSAKGPLPSVEARSVTDFRTFPSFAFLGIHCTNNAGDDVHLKPDQTQPASDFCNPLAPISLEFSSPVSRRHVRDFVTFEPSLKGKTGDADPWGDLSEEEEVITFPHREDRTYNVYLPYGLKAAAAYHLSIPTRNLGLWERMKNALLTLRGQKPEMDTGALIDKFGRFLPTGVTMNFSTNHRVPNYILEYHAAVLEKNTDSDVPIYVNNLQDLAWNYSQLTLEGTQHNLTAHIAIPKVQDLQFLMPLGIRDILKNSSGAFFGELTPTPTLDNQYRNRKLFAEISPYQVHTKLGHFNSLVWVTDLASGQPVSDANVTLYQDSYQTLAGPAKGAVTALTDTKGVAVLPGTETLDPDLSISRRWSEDTTPHFFVRVSKGKDMALLPLDNYFEINNYRSSGTSFYPSNQKKFGHMVAWGTSAEGIYHPGDTIQYKFYVRNQDNQNLTPAPRKGYWLEVVDPTGKVVHTVQNITLSEFGAVSGEFTTGQKAAVGWYNFRLKANLNKKSNADADSSSDNTDDCANSNTMDEDKEADNPENEDDASNACGTPAEFTWTPLRVLVSDFTPVPFVVRNSLNGDLFHNGDDVQVDTDAKLHSGGPYTKASVRVTGILTPGNFVSRHPAAAGFTFGTELPSTNSQQVYEVSGNLDDQGLYKTSFKMNEKDIYYGRLMVESAVQDDRGKNVAHQSYADYVGVNRFVGLRLPRWFYTSGDDIAADYLVVDERGTPVKGVPATLTLERKERVSARVKSAGSSYVPDTETQIIKENECQGVSQELAATCHLKPSHAGDYTLRATVTDTTGRTQETTLQLWVAGHDFVAWDDGSDNNLDIVPDQKTYHVGDKAHFLVKNPYPGAKALVTVERYGVLDRFVTTLTDSTSVIDLTIKPEYLPGFYLSVNIMSPRVDKPVELGQVDLAKPTFRLGYVRVPVKDNYKEIAISATPDHDVYRPGDKVHVHLSAKARYPKNEPIELAVVVLDEAVFDLIAGGENYYDPYAGFYNFEGLDLRNYSLLTRLIGRQKFEKKGANPGGDGGAALSMRSVFKYVSYWNPSIKVNPDGQADIDFTVPDNLTGWRILVLADTPSDRFGLGEGQFKVNRPTEIRPEMPNQVAEHDTFEAHFSVMNRTNTPRTLKVSLKAEGDIDTSTLPADLQTSITLKPYERRLVSLPVKAGKVREDRDLEKGEIHFLATAGDDSDRDGLEHRLPILKLRTLDVAATYGTTLTDKVSESIAFPDHIYPDVGALSVSVTPTVIGNLEGAFKYLRDYPYPCWEQVLTKGVMAAHYKALQAYISDTLKWPEAETLTDHTLALAGDYQAPGGGMTYFIPDDAHADPYLSAYTALAFNWLKHDGYKVPETVEKKLHDYLQNFLHHDEAPGFYTAGMASTVRAVALAALAEDGSIGKEDIERYAPFVKQMSLFGKAHFAKAALLVPQEQKAVIDTLNMILASSQETSGKYVFNETLDDGYARILSSPMRENCAVLDVLVSLGETAYGKDLVSDIPLKLVRTITQTRGGHDHWENTQENMFCMNALIDYSRVYEKDKPDFTVAATLDNVSFGNAAFKSFRDPAQNFEHPIAKDDPGRHATLELTRQGTGRLYYASRLSYASQATTDEGTNAGIEVHREYSLQRDGKWELLAHPSTVRQGDVVRVDLYVSLPTARNFVVVDDPIPGGFEPVNTELANASKVDAAKGAFEAAGGSLWFKYSDWSEYNFSFWSFNHKELLNKAARFYADYLPPGNYHLSYMAQAIGAGEFAIMPTMASEMYDPDVYGKTGFDHLTVQSNLSTTP